MITNDGNKFYWESAKKLTSKLSAGSKTWNHKQQLYHNCTYFHHFICAGIHLFSGGSQAIPHAEPRLSTIRCSITYIGNYRRFPDNTDLRKIFCREKYACGTEYSIFALYLREAEKIGVIAATSQLSMKHKNKADA